MNRGQRPGAATRGGRILGALWNRARRVQDAPLRVSRAEVARLAAIRAVDDLVAALVLELSVTPAGRRWPARQRLAIARELRGAVRDDFATDSNDRTAALWRRLNAEEAR